MPQHSARTDLTGQRFGRWLVISEAPSGPRWARRWFCRCDCGTEKDVNQASLIRGRTAGCRRCMGERQTTHGLSRSPEYSIWAGMIRRCENPNNRKFYMYGGRGVKVCPEWRASFAAFYEHVGPRPSPRHSIDRFPNRDGNYEPGNVRWATPPMQQRNTRMTRFLTHDGITLPMTDWAALVGMTVGALEKRLRKGWAVEQALTTPVDLSRSRRKPRAT